MNFFHFSFGRFKDKYYLCIVVWPRLCGRHIKNEALCFDLVVRNLGNFKQVKREGGNGSRYIAWAVVYLYLTCWVIPRTSNQGCGDTVLASFVCL